MAGAQTNGMAMGPKAETPLDDLLRAANRGDARAYAAFLGAVTPIVRGIARSRAAGLGADAVEDIVQETLLAIHQKRQTWREDRPVRPCAPPTSDSIRITLHPFRSTSR